MKKQKAFLPELQKAACRLYHSEQLEFQYFQYLDQFDELSDDAAFDTAVPSS